MKSAKIVVIGLILLATASANAGELIYTPINPSFGGSSFNGAWLLSSAEAQNKLTEIRDLSRLTQDPLEDFSDNLNRQILNRLSRELITSLFGEGSFADEGHYELGEFIIDILQGDDGINISITDLSNGGETNILVPYY